MTAQEIPAGKTSEEVIGAAITAGNAPCLVFNTAPAAVPQFQKQGGLVPLDTFPDGDVLRRVAHREAAADQYTVAGRASSTRSLEVQPGDDLLQQEALEKAGHRPGAPAAGDVREFLATAADRQERASPTPRSGRRRRASSSSPGSTSTRCSPPRPAASSWSRTARPRSTPPPARRSARFWRTMYAERPRAARRSTTVTRSPTARPPWRSSGRGRSRSTSDKVNWGVVPGADLDGKPADQIHTFSDAKNVGHVLRLQEPGHRLGRREVRHQQGQDGKLLEKTGQMPLRADLRGQLPGVLRGAPGVQLFAAQAARTVEVPNVPNSVEIWQTFRDAVLVLGDLRQDLGRRRLVQGGRQGHPAGRSVLTGAV